MALIGVRRRSKQIGVGKREMKAVEVRGIANGDTIAAEAADTEGVGRPPIKAHRFRIDCNEPTCIFY